jgi:hypothetical protein
MENGQPGIAELPAEARRLYACVYLDPEEAELRSS